MRIPVLPLSALICGTGFLIYGIAATGQVSAPAQATAVTGTAQIEHGAAVYKEKCATCHGENQQGTFNAPGLSGNTFQSQWRSRTVAELFGNISETMPPTSPDRSPGRMPLP
jgi:cytochrome c